MTSPRGLLGLLVAGSLGLPALGCGFMIPAPTYIQQTRMISVQAEVVELGPLNPGRVGFPSDAPIAEPMPHDRFSFEVIVVDPNGDQRAASELDSIWFQCGPFDCRVADPGAEPWPEYDRRCEDVIADPDLGIAPLTLDERCRLGEGDGRFEFEVSELGPLLAEVREANFYGVIGWNGRSAEDCWATRRSLDGLLDNCGFISRTVKVGPSWWMLAYAEQVLGITTQIPVWQIPIAVYGQAANRAPIPMVYVRVDGELIGTYPEDSSFDIQPGAHIALEASYDEIVQFGQTYFVASYDPDYDKFWWSASTEFVTETVHTTNAIHSTADVNDFTDLRVPLRFVVDELAEPGRSTIFLVHSDDRYGETVTRLDFQVQA